MPILACLLLLVAVTGAADAQDATPSRWSQERGFFVGLQLHTNLIEAEDPGPDSEPDQLFIDEVGHGLMLFGGYTFTPEVDLRISVGSARHDTNFDTVDALQSTLTLEAHYRFLASERARPYVFGGFGGTSVKVTANDIEAEIIGGAATLGFGMVNNLTRHMVIDFAARLDLVNWNQIQVRARIPGQGTVQLSNPVEQSGRAFKILLGAAWLF